MHAKNENTKQHAGPWTCFNISFNYLNFVESLAYAFFCRFMCGFFPVLFNLQKSILPISFESLFIILLFISITVKYAHLFLEKLSRAKYQLKYKYSIMKNIEIFYVIATVTLLLLSIVIVILIIIIHRRICCFISNNLLCSYYNCCVYSSYYNHWRCYFGADWNESNCFLIIFTLHYHYNYVSQ